jgi:predicted amidohydrolase
MIIALASPRIATSVDDGLEQVRAMMADAAGRGAGIVCFPEAYLPGLRGQDFEVPAYTEADEARALEAIRGWARDYKIAAVVGMEHITPDGLQIVAVVIDATGTLLGMQTKNQLDPTEEPNYVPGTTRRVFNVGGLTFGVVICHEGWRYPETVRWAATRGAKVVFHPQLTGSDKAGPQLDTWGAAGNPYYEKAMMMRSRENTIYFASVNYGVRFQEAATTLIAPSGECQAHLPYGHAGVLVQELDLDSATGLLAERFAPDRYAEG